MGLAKSVVAVVVALAVLAALAGATAVAATDRGGQSATPGVGEAPEAFPAQEAFPVPGGIDPDDVLLRVAIREDGSAVWTVQYRVRLDDPNDTAGFRTVRERIADNRSGYVAPFEERIRAMAADAGNATGRAMVVENVSVEAERRQLPQEYGVVTYRFRWYGFADRGDRMVVGDALRGLFLDDQTRLLVTWPEDTRADTVAPPPDERRERSAVWSGPTDFGNGEPRVVLTTDGGFTPESTDGFPVEALTTGGLLVLVGVGGIRAVRRRRSSDGDAAGDDSAADRTASGRSGDRGVPDAESSESDRSSPGEPSEGESTSDDVDRSAEEDEATTVEDRGRKIDDGATATEEGTSSEDGRTAPDEDASPDDATAFERSGPASADPQGATDDPPPEELLSNEERVLRLIEDRGGRIKQQTVVEETGWSETKTSEVVQGLRDDEKIEVYRLGRENVLALPGESGFEIGGDR